MLRADDIQRLQLDMPTLLANAEKLGVWRSTGQSKLQAIYAAQTVAEPTQADPELQLYEGFIGDADRRILPLIREADGPMLAKTQWPLRDQRLVDMLLRYRARNFPASLNETEQAQWQAYCRGRMSGEVQGAPVTLQAFLQAAEEALTHCTDPGQHALLGSWKQFALARCNALGVTTQGGMEG